MGSRPERRAVVIGGGIAGLLTARVLAPSYDRVTVVERDPGPDADGGPRRGAPQGAHLHGLLDGGRRLMEELFPGISDELVAAGAPSAEPLYETRWYLHGRRLAPARTGMRSVLATRPFLEDALRARTRVLPGVEVDGPATVTGLVGRARGPVTGVRIADRGGEREVPADLVVDASGRSSRAVAWLAGLGHAVPDECRVDVDLGYATRMYRREPGSTPLGGPVLGITVSTIPRSRGGGCLAVERDRWLVTLAGMLGDHPPRDGAGFEAFAATLPAPDVHDVIRRCEPLTDPVPYRFRGSRWLRFDRLSAPPEGFLVLGDALCSVNPLYAQGMSLAAQQVDVLRRLLERDPHVSPAAFHRGAGARCRAAWEIATRADLALPEVEGSRPWAARPLDAYVRRVQQVAHHDPVVSRAFLRVANLADPPAALLDPRLVPRVLRPRPARG